MRGRERKGEKRGNLRACLSSKTTFLHPFSSSAIRTPSSRTPLPMPFLRYCSPVVHARTYAVRSRFVMRMTSAPMTLSPHSLIMTNTSFPTFSFSVFAPLSPSPTLPSPPASPNQFHPILSACSIYPPVKPLTPTSRAMTKPALVVRRRAVAMYCDSTAMRRNAALRVNG